MSEASRSPHMCLHAPCDGAAIDAMAQLSVSSSSQFRARRPHTLCTTVRPAWVARRGCRCLCTHAWTGSPIARHVCRFATMLPPMSVRARPPSVPTSYVDDWRRPHSSQSPNEIQTTTHQFIQDMEVVNTPPMLLSFGLAVVPAIGDGTGFVVDAGDGCANHCTVCNCTQDCGPVSMHTMPPMLLSSEHVPCSRQRHNRCQHQTLRRSQIVSDNDKAVHSGQCQHATNAGAV